MSGVKNYREVIHENTSGIAFSNVAYSFSPHSYKDKCGNVRPSIAKDPPVTGNVAALVCVAHGHEGTFSMTRRNLKKRI
jgi:hypothetical protein